MKSIEDGRHCAGGGGEGEGEKLNIRDFCFDW